MLSPQPHPSPFARQGRNVARRRRSRYREVVRIRNANKFPLRTAAAAPDAGFPILESGGKSLLPSLAVRRQAPDGSGGHHDAGHHGSERQDAERDAASYEECEENGQSSEEEEKAELEPPTRRSRRRTSDLPREARILLVEAPLDILENPLLFFGQWHGLPIIERS